MKEQIPKNASTRTICSCLDDMRNCLKTQNFSYLSSLIEEIQYRANRMENALEITGGWEGIPSRINELRKLRRDIKVLRKEEGELEDKIEALKG